LTGWTAGAGSEVFIAPRWTARLEYLYTDLGRATAVFPSGASYSSGFDVHTVRLGLNYKLEEPHSDGTRSKPAQQAFGEFKNWELHGQTTYIQQGYPSFNSPYVGQNSFTPWAQTRQTWTNTAYFGFRVGPSGEFYFAPELLQGFGLHDT